MTGAASRVDDEALERDLCLSGCEHEAARVKYLAGCGIEIKGAARHGEVDGAVVKVCRADGPGRYTKASECGDKAAGECDGGAAAFDGFGLLCGCIVRGDHHGQSHDGSRNGQT